MVSSLERFPCDVLKYTYKKGQNVTRGSLDSILVHYKMNTNTKRSWL